jgi:hypothetical protein
MSTKREDPALFQILRKVPGTSEAFLAKATDGFQYIVKFSTPIRQPNLPFNEAAGTELYRMAHLTTPGWRPLRITESFLDRNRRCWLHPSGGFMPPPAGLCFGSCYLGGGAIRTYQLLPGHAYVRVRNRDDFWLAWLLDVCARHADNRQAVFCQGLDARFCAVFIDHGHMFGGPAGEREPHLIAPAYLDRRIYQALTSKQVRTFRRDVLKIDWDGFWSKAQKLPAEWKTDSGLARLSACLDSLSCSKFVENVFHALNAVQNQAGISKAHDASPDRKSTLSVLRPRIQLSAGSGCIVA